MNTLHRRAFVMSAAMVATAAAGAMLQPRSLSADEVRDPRLDALFPSEFGDWRIDPISRPFVRPSDERGRILGVYDRLLERTYIDKNGYRMMLSAAYVANAFEGSALQLHRPEVCYRYAGYRVGETAERRLPVGRSGLAATRLRTELPGRIEPVTYWVVVGNEVPNDRTALRWTRIHAQLRRQVLDSLLVRISSIDGDEERAYRIQAEFAAAMARSVPPADEARIFGTRVAAAG